MRISSRPAVLPLAALAVFVGGCPQKAPSDVKAGSDIPAQLGAP